MNFVLDRESKMGRNNLHFDTQMRVICGQNGFDNYEVIAPYHYRISSNSHDHVVEIWFDGGFWVNHVTNDMRFYAGSITNVRYALATIRDYCF